VFSAYFSSPSGAGARSKKRTLCRFRLEGSKKEKIW